MGALWRTQKCDTPGRTQGPSALLKFYVWVRTRKLAKSLGAICQHFNILHDSEKSREGSHNKPLSFTCPLSTSHAQSRAFCTEPCDLVSPLKHGSHPLPKPTWKVKITSLLWYLPYRHHLSQIAKVGMVSWSKLGCSTGRKWGLASTPLVEERWLPELPFQRNEYVNMKWMEKRELRHKGATRTHRKMEVDIGRVGWVWRTFLGWYHILVILLKNYLWPSTGTCLKREHYVLDWMIRIFLLGFPTVASWACLSSL